MPVPDSTRGDLRNWIIAVALVVTIAAIGFLSVDVVRRIDALATASSDSVQWSLSQVEVEFLQLEAAVLRADLAAAPDLADVRQRFDIFYSRIDTLGSSQVFADLRGQAAFGARLAAVQAFLERTVPLIDSADAALLTALPRIERDVGALREDVRMMSLRGISTFAAQSDAGREGVSNTLTRVGGLSLLLLIALLLLLGIVMTLYRQGQVRSGKAQTTSARLRAIVATSLDAIIVANRQGLVLDYNGAAEAIFGYDRSEAVGARLSDLIVPDHYRDAHEAGMVRYRKTGVPHVVGKGRMQLEARRKNAEVFPVEMSINSAEGEFGEIFVAFLRDISARKAAEQALMQARDEALAGEKAKADLLAVMSHEMRTPLNGLLGTMELLERTELDPKQRNYLAIMATSGDILLHHVNDVLDISRLDSGAPSGQMTRFNVSQLVKEVADGLAGIALASGNVLTFTDTPGPPEMVLGDPRRLRQVLLNLVGNAVKFTKNGTITVEVERLKGTGEMEFRVIDTGIGIAESDYQRVFEDFVTLDTSFGRETGGTGLGLAITRRLVMSMGGQIGLESEPGEGSLFWVRLPLRAVGDEKRTPRRKRVPGVGARQPGRGMSVLVVEDNPINRLIAREMLESLGCRVAEAADGEEGVALAEAERFDLIFMDISMPRMDGVAATRAIRTGTGRSKEARIVSLTAHALPNDIARFREAGMEAALVKPLTRRALSVVLGSDPAPSADEDSAGWQEDAVTEKVSELIEYLGGERAHAAIQAFLDEGEKILDWLEGALTFGKDLPDIAAEAHRLAGSAAVFGARGLNACLREVETAARQGDLLVLSQAIMEARKAWSSETASIGGHLKKADR